MDLVDLGLTTLAAAFVGSYLAGYLKKKGENLATHEDIDRLVDQVRAVTTAAKEIEAKISGDLWDRQKRWELKRDVLFEMTKRLGEVKDTLSVLLSVYATDRKGNLQGDLERGQLRLKVGQEWLDAAARFDNTSVLIGIVCGDQLLKTVLQFSLYARGMATKVTAWNADTIDGGMGPFGAEMSTFMDALRKELAGPK